jgi:hypothetical protein
MDPYLEDPALWPDVHHAVIETIRDLLVPRVRPRYTVRVEQRVYLNDVDDPAFRLIVPDLRVVTPADAARQPARQASASASAAITEPVIVPDLLDEDVAEARVEIIDRADKAVVTVIEVVSPANKVRGAAARTSFVTKRKEITASPAHWLEIDLLRTGVRTAYPAGVRESDYLVYLDRQTGERRTRYAWPIDLKEPLPVIATPLREPDADVPLDLQAVLNGVYDRCGYDLEVNYTREPSPPLAPPAPEWAAQLLADKGLR